MALRLLLFVRVRAVAAVEAAGGGAEHAVMAGIMAGDPADDRTLDSALGVGRRARGNGKHGNGDGGKCGLHVGSLPEMRCRCLNRERWCEVPSRISLAEQRRRGGTGSDQGKNQDAGSLSKIRPSPAAAASLWRERFKVWSDISDPVIRD